MLSPERAAPSAVLRANSQAHLAKWGTDPCAEVTADRSPGVEISTAVTAGAGDPLQLRLPAALADAFVQRINDQGQGRVGWPASTE